MFGRGQLYVGANLHSCMATRAVTYIVHLIKPASNDLDVYVNKFGKTSVVWRYTLQSIGPSGIALNY